MKAEELKDLVEKYKAEHNYNDVDRKKVSFDYDAKREAAMQGYLNDVGPVSQYINNGFEEIEKSKSEGMQK